MGARERQAGRHRKHKREDRKHKRRQGVSAGKEGGEVEQSFGIFAPVIL